MSSPFLCLQQKYLLEAAVSLGGSVRCNSLYFQVYTVGPDYAHAEARKSPALDGKVERDSEGKEIRYPVMLTAMEKLVARKVCVAFKVCIFFPVQAGLHKCLIHVRVGVKTCHPGMSQAWQSSVPDASCWSYWLWQFAGQR